MNMTASTASVTPLPTQRRTRISRAEFETYVNNGHFTGFLLETVACFTGLSKSTLARTCDIPERTVAAIMSGREIGLRSDLRQRIYDALGIDATTARLSANRVHMIDLDGASKSMPSRSFPAAMRAIGFLLRDSAAARLDFSQTGATSWFAVGERAIKMKAVAVQNRHSTAIFIEPTGAFSKVTFDLQCIPGGRWARSSKHALPLTRQYALHIQRQEMLPVDFREMFDGDTGTTWEDVHLAARVRGLTRSEVIAILEERDLALGLPDNRIHAAVGLR